MKQIFKPEDFKEYFEDTDSLVAATIAQQKVEKFLMNLVRDPTNGAKSDFPSGYRQALIDIMSELEEK